MILVAMDAAVGDETDEVKPCVCGLGKGLDEHRICRKIAIGDRFIDAGKILIDNASGTEIQVPDFRVPHLSFGQTDIHAAATEMGDRIFLVHLASERGIRKPRAVPVALRSLRPCRIVTPSIPNNKNDWFFRHILESSGRFRIRASVSKGNAPPDDA